METFLDVKLIKTLAMAKQVVDMAPDDHMDKYFFYFLVFACVWLSKATGSLGKDDLLDSLYTV